MGYLTEAIETEGYNKFINDVVNNQFGGFPMVLGEGFEVGKFKASQALGMVRGKYGVGVVMSAMVDNDKTNSSMNVIYVSIFLLRRNRPAL